MKSYTATHETSATLVFARRAGLASFFFGLLQLLASGVQLIVLFGERVFISLFVFGPFLVIAQAIAGVPIELGDTKLIFALHQVDFVFKVGNLFLLVGDLSLP